MFGVQKNKSLIIVSNKSTEEFIAWINRKYEEYVNIVDKINKIPN